MKERKNKKERKKESLARKNIRTTQFRIESVSNLGVKLWDLLPVEIKKKFFPHRFQQSENGSLINVHVISARHI